MKYQIKEEIHMIYKTLYVQTSFEAGKTVGEVNHFLGDNNAGYARLVAIDGSVAEIELACTSSIIMSYCESRLAAYV